jgi:hypothetical protein
MNNNNEQLTEKYFCELLLIANCSLLIEKAEQLYEQHQQDI